MAAYGRIDGGAGRLPGWPQYVASGVGANPELQPGRFSSESRFQERITDALYRGAIAPP